MDWKIKVVIIPVSDVDRSKHFYHDLLGFNVDLDDSPSPTHRFVQLTPPGSGCSITIGTGMTEMVPGSVQGIQIVVDDITVARKQLVDNGVDVSPVRHFEKGGWVDGPGGRWNSFVFFSDPDGNGWVLQERGTD